MLKLPGKHYSPTIACICEGKVWLLVKKYQLPKTDRKTYAFPKEQNYGDFVETRVKKSPTSPGLIKT
jgi:hypothetical protein